ncbi:polyprenyl diphosphate synthase [Saccharibacter floricola]|uniref:Isoprenyl transferase n=1 Tax=Saccharibacter floricola DSM 15669 TaxID=1123227 RepID=A0ABQ0NYZ8_9PROT|nr:polyprenyl diphosphate synthase [Saccharibacter floricola]GBQ06816.1 undecaprenyl pyrophosphate synthetase [Saccharibacter floricola DSM 15669]
MTSSSHSSASTTLGAEVTPRHIAIIMDGNGRWARRRGVPVAQGHKEGGEAVQRCVRAALKNEVPFLTLYAFSSENWRRSHEEVGELTSLLRFYLKHKLADLHRQGVRLRIIGEPEHFGAAVCQELQRAEEKTAQNKRLTMLLALSYGGRAEMVGAARSLACKVEAGLLHADDIDEAALSASLQTHDIPDPDVIVRTSGEKRLSNFLLWQSAYAELIFLEKLWPDFQESDFSEIIKRYARRQRRFGGRPSGEEKASS